MHQSKKIIRRRSSSPPEEKAPTAPSSVASSGSSKKKKKKSKNKVRAYARVEPFFSSRIPGKLKWNIVVSIKTKSCLIFSCLFSFSLRIPPRPRMTILSERRNLRRRKRRKGSQAHQNPSPTPTKTTER